MRKYRTSSVAMEFFEFLAWAIVILGFLAAIAGYSMVGILFGFGGNSSAMVGIVGAVPGIIIVALGVMGVVHIQVARSNVDIAIMTGDLLEETRTQSQLLKSFADRSGPPTRVGEVPKSDPVPPAYPAPRQEEDEPATAKPEPVDVVAAVQSYSSLRHARQDAIKGLAAGVMARAGELQSAVKSPATLTALLGQHASPKPERPVLKQDGTAGSQGAADHKVANAPHAEPAPVREVAAAAPEPRHDKPQAKPELGGKDGPVDLKPETADAQQARLAPTFEEEVEQAINESLMAMNETELLAGEPVADASKPA
ncbi:MAG: hypothetical protein KDJ74_06775 [Notoacmeibacter sp.]|nr:hypothetical protein [Notoacmeibacter sp.]